MRSDPDERRWGTKCADGSWSYDGGHFEPVVYGHSRQSAEILATFLDSENNPRRCANGPHRVVEIIDEDVRRKDQAVALALAKEEADRGIRQLCLGCEQPIDVRVPDGTWTDVGIGDYAHNWCGPELLRGDGRVKWVRTWEPWWLLKLRMRWSR